MKAFTGKARLHIDGHVAHVSISLNPQAGSFEAEMLSSALPDELFHELSGPARVVQLSDIEIPLPTGTLTCAELEDIYIGGDGGVTSSINETPISRALNLSDDRSGIRRITLRPKAALVPFRHNPPLEQLSELYFLNNFVKGITATIALDGASINFLQRDKSLSVTSTVDLRPLLPRVKAAWAVLQGAHLTHAASYNSDGTVDLAVRRPRAYHKGRSLFHGWENQESLLAALLQSFASKDEADFKGWEKAITFYLEGRNSELRYDVQIIAYMIFIEMFDGARTMGRNTISKEFSCSLELADFLVRMRNKLIHNRMTLWDSVPQVHAEILQHQPDWICPEIAFAPEHYEKNSILFFLHLERLVNSFVVGHVRYTGRFDDNAELIADLESKMFEQDEDANADNAKE